MLVKELGYKQSLADPCISFKHKEIIDENGNPQIKLCGVIAVATDDLLHGGDDEHLRCMQEIQKRYKLGKYQFGQGDQI